MPLLDGGGVALVLELCDRELAACGLKPAKRSTFDRSRLTAQELAVARLVAVGMSNRQVASTLFISIKTVQFHLSHVYAKLGLGSRGEVAAHFRDYEMTEGSADPGQLETGGVLVSDKITPEFEVSAIKA